MADKYCLNCGSRIPDGLKYCPVCGSPVQSGTKQTRNTIHSKVLLDEPDLENEPLPVEPKNNEQTQRLNVDAIRTVQPKAEPVEETVSETRKPKHGKLYSAFIEDDDDDDYDDYEEEEEDSGHHSHAALIVLLIILAFLAGILIFMLTQKSSFVSSLFHSTDSEKTSVVETATPEPTVAPTETPAATEAPVENNGAIGSLEVVQESINVRSQPTTDSDQVGTVAAGETYQVYETTNDGTMDWYRIGDNQWIADAGGWVNYTAN